ncbi:MAG: tRNA-dependent cyclodipeptide synthase [Nanoarchaeota archaeon]|nr:tRNA-dependent cyclodipeptide synthase [Nanoarchaeota archaeon]
MKSFVRKGIAYQNGQQIMDRRECGLIWMSAGNSYFSENVIRELILFAKDNFSTIIVAAPDIPAEHTYLALGYSESESKRKARLNANLLRNRAQRAIKQLEQENISSLLLVVDWSKDVEPNEFYQKAYKKVCQLYDENEFFKKDALLTTLQVLRKKINITEDMEKTLNEGVFYLLKELAFIIALPFLFNVNNVAYLYHRNWPIYEKFISGKYDGEIKKNLGFVIVK